MTTKESTQFTFTCTQENLLRGLQRTAPVAGRNSQLPILGYILFQAKNGVIQLTATDLEVGIITTVGGGLKGSGAAALPARSVFSYVQQLPNTHPIVIEYKDAAVHITTTHYSAAFPTANTDDFPLLPSGTSKTTYSVSGKDLSSGIDQVLFSAARDETRPEIRGVYFQTDESGIKLAATDSFRLAEALVKMKLKKYPSFILPTPSAQEVVRVFADQDEVVVSPQENYILFSSGEVELTSRLVDGSYPNYQQIIPQSSGTTMLVDREEFLRSLKTLSVFLPSGSRRVELIVTPSKKRIRAQVSGGEVGAGEVEVSAEGTGKDVKVLVNIQYILEGLQRMGANECEIGFTSDASPIVMRPKLGSDEFVYVVMPIRT
ncbi:MAG: DNA polymerase III subunit beta [Candidatus Andersenbacteria bacterium]|nr:DNA polymerase III subunit beta [Candidatus Andersenbacteria bacterium]